MESDEQEIKYEEKYVAFLDILGFKEMIEQDKEESIKTIIKIKTTFDNAIEALTSNMEKIVKDHKTKSPERYRDLENVSIKMFSDCFCISNNDLVILIIAMEAHQLFLATENIFVRGGIAKGNHFEDSTIIFSKGLVEAYKLESKKAIYPRILLHKDLIRELQSNKDLYLTCDDGLGFIDYLGYMKWLDHDTENSCILKLKESIHSQIENSKDDSVTQKYNWLVEYFNHKYPEFRINSSEFKFAYKEFNFE